MKRPFIFKSLKDIQEFLVSDTFRLSYSNSTREYHLEYLIEDNVTKKGDDYEFFDKSEDSMLTMEYCFETIIGGGFSIKFSPNLLDDVMPHKA